MTEITTLIKKFLESRRHSRQERVAAYELAGLAVRLYQENMRLKKELFVLLRFIPRDFQAGINEESRFDG